MLPEVGKHYLDDQDRIVTITAEVKTCCSPKFFHGKVLIDGQVNVFAYDNEGCILSHMFVQQRLRRLVKEIE